MVELDLKDIFQPDKSYNSTASSPPHPTDRAGALKRKPASPFPALEIFCVCKRNCCKERGIENREGSKHINNQETTEYRRAGRTASERKPGELLSWVLLQRGSLLTAL